MHSGFIHPVSLFSSHHEGCPQGRSLPTGFVVDGGNEGGQRGGFLITPAAGEGLGVPQQPFGGIFDGSLLFTGDVGTDPEPQFTGRGGGMNAHYPVPLNTHCMRLA